VPQALKEVLDRALAKNPAARFQRAADLAGSLRAIALRPYSPSDQSTQVPVPIDRAPTVIEPVPSVTIHEPRPPRPVGATPTGATQNAPTGAMPATPRPGTAGTAGTGAVSTPPPVAPAARSSPPWMLLGGIGLVLVVCLLISLGIGAALGGPAIAALLGRSSATPGAETAEPTRLAAATATTGQAEASATPEGQQATDAPPETAAVPTEAPSEPPTETAEPTATPEPTAVPVPEGMVLAPAGAFNMGAEVGGDAGPVHPVTLSAFFMDQTEVTNAAYQACVDAGGCTAPQRRGSDTRGNYFTDPAFANYPVLNVTWDQADAFCRAAGKRLPTEAEWEYAASGGDGRLYPWGNTFDPTLVPVQSNDTVAVGSFPGGASPLGVLDMAGNALEWVSDWYDPGYYAVAPPENPTGPGTGSRKVLRGGSFGNPDASIYINSRRFNRPPNGADVDIGFRCAMPAP
jgi:formylglycine-generating enzyme required for sulfatase activity